MTLDLRGHGLSAKPVEKSKYKIECFARDVYEIIKKQKIKKFVLIGHSMGGMIALSYYKLFKKKPIAIVLCDTTASLFRNRKIKKLSPFVKHVLDFLISHSKIREKHFSHLKDIDLNRYKKENDFFIFYHCLHNTPMKSVFSILENMMKFSAVRILDKINIPVLVIEGEDDKILPILDSLDLYHEIKDSEIEFVPMGKHLVNLQDAKEVDRFIYNFLRIHKIN